MLSKQITLAHTRSVVDPFVKSTIYTVRESKREATTASLSSKYSPSKSDYSHSQSEAHKAERERERENRCQGEFSLPPLFGSSSSSVVVVCLRR